MASSLCRRQCFAATPMWRSQACRTLSTTGYSVQRPASTPLASTSELSEAPNTHFKITLRRSAISLGKKIQGTLLALGFHRRHQTVYFPHSPETAGKILRIKELVEVENVPAHLALTKQEQRLTRKAPNGYEVLGSRKGSFMNI